MKINVRGRRSGCTYDLIVTADVIGGIVVCPNRMRAEHVKKMAREMERNIRVMTFDECKRDTHIKNFNFPLLIDGIELAIEELVKEKYGNVVGCMFQDKYIMPHIFGLEKEVTYENT